ncbi:MAG: hypothetical protein QF632_02990 [Candidatus Woesearchaeota archaeon]|jgi:hypothetical protein|nr:hypothetical protein [Candidatus Woesearchaeota archaeon]
MPEKYWFRMPDFEGRQIHVTTWDEVGIKQRLPPPIVAAVPDGDYFGFAVSSPDRKISYLSEHEDCLGFWIPSQTMYRKLENDHLQSLKSEYDLNQNPDLIDILGENIDSIFKKHIKLSSESELNHLARVDVANSLLSSVKFKKGMCWDKATLLAGFIGDSHPYRVVGFEQFDMETWREIARTYPPHTMTPQDRLVPSIFNSSFASNSEDSSILEVFLPLGTVLRIDPNEPCIDRHYWVEATVNGKEKVYDAVDSRVKADESYQFLRGYFSKMQFDCATCELAGNQVVSTNPPRK